MAPPPCSLASQRATVRQLPRLNAAQDATTRTVGEADVAVRQVMSARGQGDPVPAGVVEKFLGRVHSLEAEVKQLRDKQRRACAGSTAAQARDKVAELKHVAAL